MIAGTKARLVIKGPAHVGTRVVLTKPDGREGTVRASALVSERGMKACEQSSYKNEQVDEIFDLPMPAPDTTFTYNYPGSEGFYHEIVEVTELFLHMHLFPWAFGL